MKFRFAAAVLAPFVLAPLPAVAVDLENPVLVVRTDELPLSAGKLEGKLRHALYWGGIRMLSPETFASLSTNIARALDGAGSTGLRTVCADGDRPCVTVFVKPPR